ncbi:hypothetical protein [uncultured Devosia sp.]|uniref:hypothetical protein n=1 Tax=uncultured Devosia sp. TaxID=211434 RepID=UPI0035CC8516
MPRISNLFFKTAVVFLLVGIGIGLKMSISQNHDVIGAHAHINLLGWVTSAIFGGYYALNPAKAASGLAMAHYLVYTAGVAIMGVSLYLLLQGNLAFEGVVAVSSLITLAGVLIFAWVLFAPEGSAARAVPAE